MSRRKLLVMGLPGAGKTTLAQALAPLLEAVRFNADEVRQNLSPHLGFSLADRVEHARRMGWLCDQVTAAGGVAIADFICPTPETRDAFGPAFTVWVDRIARSRFPDTDALFQPPDRFDVRVTAEGTPEHWADRIARIVRPAFVSKRPTALLVGRYQPFHEGHRALVAESIRRVGQVCIAVRDTHGTSGDNPFTFDEVAARIDAALQEFAGRYRIVPLPNVTHVFYGRDVGYVVERLELDETLTGISATRLREALASGPAPQKTVE